MVYHGTVSSEKIAFHPAGEPTKLHYIELTKSPNEPLFWVSCCCHEDWFYEFTLESNSDYERIKFNVIQSVFECEDMDELLVTLSEIFEDGFSDILMEDERQCKEEQDDKYLN